VIEIRVPDLKERREDIPLLADRFLSLLNDQYKSNPKTFSDDAMEHLMRHDYPGNIRELENIIERSYTLCSGETIECTDIIIPGRVQEEPLEDNTYQPGNVPLDDHLAEIERQALMQALEKAGGNKTVAAQTLGMSFRSIRYKLKKYGL
jgi:two-component system, NtrC family, response regulator PilR